MNKAELVAKVAEKTELSKRDAEKAVNAFISSVSESLANGEPVQLVGFGSFIVTERAARDGRNPATGKVIRIEAKRVVGFRAGKGLKDMVN